VQVVVSHRRGHRVVEHIGSANDAVTLALLRAAGAQRLEQLRLQHELPLDGQTATPVYDGAAPVAQGITLQAHGSGGLSFHISIINRGSSESS